MKKILSLALVLIMICGVLSFTACNTTPQIKVNPDKQEYIVGICQLMVHDSLDQATNGFKDALTVELEKAGRTVKFEFQVAGEVQYCSTVINTLTAKDVDLIMANATDALLAAANGTVTIPILGTSVTDYNDTFRNNIPANVSGTSDAVPFDEQAQMMIETLGLTSDSQVGVIYCTNESNSVIQYEAVKALFEAEGVKVKAYTFSDTTELSAVTNTAVSESDAIYVPSDNTVAQNDTIVGTACNEKNVPVFTSYGGTICYASLAIDYYQLGYETGVMAAKVLLGQESITDMEIKTLIPTVVYNEELCEKLGVAVPQK